MNASSILRVAVPVVALVACVGAAQTPESRVNLAFDKLESEWLERLNVSESLSPGREDLALLMRKDASVARSWQLETSVAATMTTDEIFQFVVSRANAMLACRVAQLARKDLRAPSLPSGRGAPASAAGRSDQTTAASGALITQRLWRNNLVEDGLRLSAGCNVLLNEEGQPATLATRQEVSSAGRLMNRAIRPTSRRQLFEAVLEPSAQASAEAQLKANVDYLRHEYGGPPDRQPDMEAILGRSGTQVFSRQVLVFEAFLSVTGSTDRLILVVPLSE
jgi:hypothetical protein